MNWYYAIEGRALGPVNEEYLGNLLSDGVLNTATLIWHPGLEEWQPVAKLKPELLEKVEAKKTPSATKPVVENTRPPATLATPAKQTDKPEAKGFFKRLFGRSKK